MSLQISTHCFGVPIVDFQQVNGSWDNTYCAFICIDCLLEIKSAPYSKEVYQAHHINFLNQKRIVNPAKHLRRKFLRK